MLQNLTKKVRGKLCPWLTRGIKTKMIDRDRLLRKMRKTKLENDITACKMKRNKANICLRKAKSKKYQNLLDENFRTPDRFWKVIKRMHPAKNKQSLSSKSFEVNSELTSDPTLIKNGFAYFYTEIAPKLKKLLLPLNVIWRKEAECENFTFRTFKFRYVSVLSVQKHLKNLQRAKACGLDQPPPNLLKDTANEIAPSLTYIINLSLTASTVPTNWKKAKVSPIYDSGSTT